MRATAVLCPPQFVFNPTLKGFAMRLISTPTPTPTPSRRLPALALLFGLALTSVPAAAHDIVLLPQPGGGLLVRYGHAQDWLSVGR